jgi:hypothetical protein
MYDLYIYRRRQLFRGTLSSLFIERKAKKLKTDTICGINVVSLAIF